MESVFLIRFCSLTAKNSDTCTGLLSTLGGCSREQCKHSSAKLSAPCFLLLPHHGQMLMARPALAYMVSLQTSFEGSPLPRPSMNNPRRITELCNQPGDL